MSVWRDAKNTKRQTVNFLLLASLVFRCCGNLPSGDVGGLCHGTSAYTPTGSDLMCLPCRPFFGITACRTQQQQAEVSLLSTLSDPHKALSLGASTYWPPRSRRRSMVRPFEHESRGNTQSAQYRGHTKY